MGLLGDLKVLYHLAVKPVRGKDHAARMESFYSGQAEAYDDFRKRLLKGREELYREIQPPDGGLWVDMGGGTGSNVEYFANSIPKLGKVLVVDLSPSLLAVGRKRFAAKGWHNVEAVEADATTFQPDGMQADVVTFSYSLTMIPDWFAAIENAIAMLKPGGVLGVVDFYVARKFPRDGLKKHSWFTRTFWPTWFGMDNVFPSADHVPFLHRHLEPIRFEEHVAKVPYIPLIRTPYYLFVGRKRG
ncbi:Methyltransferase type 12 [Pirellula staleyi DSM 6068]|uniref:Methyltransferase type 12 n=1 Tax=Pirellula staleyi (strain ATCC 27377 / DSM 6068 / ICPB 4128) TaxID=530564 RepID=D2QZP1_PIRSD|nr:class I SAM-dependent methyltransferase [Pirellula staleyi]ADB16524.1 Methyltransferase type 12 [Pirellula staleyi DSM 6068]